ncbi:putative efflux pump membrane fusion protein [Roseovarius litorisediminis]|uniref:Putative efflux pump membrane fusion protein n=1 Tax=Roseovarius litorisediminis TaxID=1312363 RepID=A0A1Y5S257_9RHOB|nr:HlyD family efflux transporter periplasmic adaptor subunit [Roseovarius litorisediminis]SLN30613.1 putative efflux pump membrane fusion protein [Roseovarius litorisediminis]
MSGFLCGLPLIGALTWLCPAEPPFAAGYAEGEYVLVAPIEVATIASLSVERGDRIAADQPLVELERRDAEIAVAQAHAALAEAKSSLADLHQGQRPEEIAVLEASLASAKAQMAEAERVMYRQSELLSRGISAQAQFDEASTAMKLARAKVVELEADLAVARLPARPDKIKSAEASVAQAQAALDQAKWRLEHRTLSIGSPGIVSDIIRNAGEVAGPQAPVLSVLPDGAIKLRLYVPEPSLAQVSVGDRLVVTCDGCTKGLGAQVSYISDHPEFTPPVIYARDSRQKLVFLLEARPLDGSSSLKPGQIVDVLLEEPGE